MRSLGTLRSWTRKLLPTHTPCAQRGAWELVRALLVGFTTNLTQLARQTDRPTSTKGARQYLERWLNREHWEPTEVYAQLNRYTRRVLGARQTVPLLMDVTFLEGKWAVLQVSVPWQQRALPLYRAVRRWEDPDDTETPLSELVADALKWLGQHLPGPRDRYVLVADRGFPSHALVRQLQKDGWRFVLRAKSNWKLTHPEHTGWLRECPDPSDTPRLYANGTLGSREKGEGKRLRHSQAHVVAFHGAGYQDVWYLLTSETNAGLAVRLYWERMRIEQEFRDLKGPFGLDQLARWDDVNEVGRFLLWVAVYEWWLAFLWLEHDLETWGAALRVKGRLSWIRITREWVARQWRAAKGRAPACL